MPIVLLITGLLIIIVLAVIAFRLQSQVYRQQKEHEALRQEQQQKLDDHRQYINNSIQILSQGLLQDDKLTLTEGSIRISVLLDNLHLDPEVKEEFSAFYHLAEATSHIPILDAWKKLPIKERMKFDNDRVAAEEKFGDFVKDAAQRIQGREF